MRYNLRTVLAIAVGVAAFAAPPTDLPVGTRLEAFSLPDQRGRVHRVDEGTRLLLFSRDKALTGMAFQLLDPRGGSYLADRGAWVILDISAMPAAISWALAKPRMRRHAFPILLDEGPGPTRALPVREGNLTLVYLKHLQVERVGYVATGAGLAQALQALP